MNEITEDVQAIELKQCPLCKNKVELLEESHILPKQLYKFLKQQRFDLIQHDIEKDKLIISDKQWKIYLLCGDCEDLFQKKEQRFSIFQRKISNLKPHQMKNLHCRYTEKLNSLKVNLSPEILTKADLDIVKYFVLSILIRIHYLKPLNFSEENILALENYLRYPNKKFPVDMNIYFHTNEKKFPAFGSPFVLDQLENKHISFLAFDLFVYITFVDSNIPKFETINCTTEDFYNPDKRNLPFNSYIEDARKTYQSAEKTAKVQKIFDEL